MLVLFEPSCQATGAKSGLEAATFRGVLILQQSLPPGLVKSVLRFPHATTEGRALCAYPAPAATGQFSNHPALCELEPCGLLLPLHPLPWRLSHNCCMPLCPTISACAVMFRCDSHANLTWECYATMPTELPKLLPAIQTRGVDSTVALMLTHAPLGMTRSAATSKGSLDVESMTVRAISWAARLCDLHFLVRCKSYTHKRRLSTTGTDVLWGQKDFSTFWKPC